MTVSPYELLSTNVKLCDDVAGCSAKSAKSQCKAIIPQHQLALTKCEKKIFFANFFLVFFFP